MLREPSSQGIQLLALLLQSCHNSFGLQLGVISDASIRFHAVCHHHDLMYCRSSTGFNKVVFHKASFAITLACVVDLLLQV